MDMERQQFSASTPQSTATLPLGHISVELTGFSGPSHYHIQTMLGEDSRRLRSAPVEDWPATRGY